MTRLKIAVVGLNFGAHMIDHHLLTGAGGEQFELAAVCDSNPVLLQKAQERTGVKAYAKLDDLLQDEEIRVIALFTGPIGRARIVRQIIRSGRDVMTTKPFETDSIEAEAVLTEARDLGRIVQLNSPTATLTDDFRLVEEWRREYNLGRPLAAEYRIWYRNRECADGTWYDDPMCCPVAPMSRIGIYGINDLVQLLGEPESVQVMESRLLTGRPTPDIAQLSIRFKNGALAHIMASFCMEGSTGGDQSLTIYYERGAIFRNPVLRDSPEVTMNLLLSNGVFSRPVEKVRLNGNSNDYQWDVFYRAIHGEPPAEPVPVNVILDGVRVIEAMSRASVSGRTEPVVVR